MSATPDPIEVLNESKIDSVTAREILKKHDAHGKNFFTLHTDQVLGLVDSAKEHGYRKSKNAPGSTGRMFHQHLHRIVDAADKRLASKPKPFRDAAVTGNPRDFAKEDTTMPNETLEEMMTRKHFQQVADVIKHIEDPVKRHELAHHHSGIFKASNPRFDHGKFFKAANASFEHPLKKEDIEMSTEDVLRHGPEALLDVILDGNRETANDIFQSVLNAKVDVALDAIKQDVAKTLFTEDDSEISEEEVVSFVESIEDDDLDALLEDLLTEGEGPSRAVVKDAKVNAHMADAHAAIQQGKHADARGHVTKAIFAAIRTGNTKSVDALRKHRDSIQVHRSPAQQATRRSLTKFSSEKRGLNNEVDLADALGIELTEDQITALDADPEKVWSEKDLEDVLGIELGEPQLEALNLWRPKEAGFKSSGISHSKIGAKKSPIPEPITHHGGSGLMTYSVDKKFAKQRRKKLGEEVSALLEAGHHHHVFADLTSQRRRMADDVANSFMRGNIKSDHKREILRHFNLADEQLGLAKDSLGTAKSAEHLNAAATHITNGGACHAKYNMRLDSPQPATTAY